MMDDFLDGLFVKIGSEGRWSRSELGQRGSAADHRSSGRQPRKAGGKYGRRHFLCALPNVSRRGGMVHDSGERDEN